MNGDFDGDLKYIQTRFVIEHILRILLVEDVASDAELELRELRRSGLSFDARIVESDVDFRRELSDFEPHIILSDFSLPRFSGMAALAIARELRPDLPFIFVSGTIGEENAVAARTDAERSMRGTVEVRGCRISPLTARPHDGE